MSPPPDRSSRQRVALIVPGFSADATDWCIPTLRDFVQMLAQHDDVWVLALRYPSAGRRYHVFGADVRAVGGGARRGAGSASIWAEAFRVIATEHRRRPFDVLHAFWADEAGAIASIAGRLLGVPTLVSLAGGEVVGLPDIGYGSQLALAQRLKVSVALRLASAISAGSSYQLRLAEPWMRRRPPGQLRRLPLGVDTLLFYPSEANERDRQLRDDVTRATPRLVHVASLVPVKDQATLLRAVAVARKSGARFDLDIVGAGSLENRLKALATSLGIDDVTHFRGAVPHHTVPRWYRSAHAFILSSRHEAQCLAALEAAACGTPTVGTCVGVLPELPPSAASTVPVGDSCALGTAIVDLLRNPNRRDEMGRAARARVESDYTLETAVAGFRRWYQELARKSERQL